MEIWVVRKPVMHAEIEGNFPWGISRKFPEIPFRICRDFCGFIGEKQWGILREILQDSQEKSWEIYKEIRGKFKGYSNVSHFLLLVM